ncbi:MAG: hypothetical protein EZS28_041233 [Streblomastix strix]|uniref:Uncharacterized protein n=1 Tax=Streblomastix strix TaxID=222440 RepID=A0A5J4TZ47_9EUKA|nr:MAG: hypothetical protein EZS28_041233 [Streblomastix strix]
MSMSPYIINPLSQQITNRGRSERRDLNNQNKERKSSLSQGQTPERNPALITPYQSQGQQGDQNAKK